MFKYLTVVACAFATMSVSYTLADDLPLQSRSFAVPRLILVQNAGSQECKRQCNVAFEACMEQMGISRQHNVSQEILRQMAMGCHDDHIQCFKDC
jgi:hypothetical protein